MSTNLSATEIQSLWQKTIGTPPSMKQFEYWLAMHAASVVRTGVLKTAERNLQMGGKMTEDYRLRFASAAMLRLGAPVVGAQ